MILLFMLCLYDTHFRWDNGHLTMLEIVILLWRKFNVVVLLMVLISTPLETGIGNSALPVIYPFSAYINLVDVFLMSLILLHKQW